jgi:hypothetical protein
MRVEKPALRGKGLGGRCSRTVTDGMRIGFRQLSAAWERNLNLEFGKVNSIPRQKARKIEAIGL